MFGAFLPPPLREELVAELRRRGAVVLQSSQNAGEEKIAFRAVEAEELLPWLSHWAHSRSLTLRRMSVEEATLEGAFLGMIGEVGEEENGRGANPIEPTG